MYNYIPVPGVMKELPASVVLVPEDCIHFDGEEPAGVKESKDVLVFVLPPVWSVEKSARKIF